MCINLSLSLPLSLSLSLYIYIYLSRASYVVCRKEKLCGDRPKATACYVAQSSETSAANIIDCTRKREDRERERERESWHEPSSVLEEDETK